MGVVGPRPPSDYVLFDSFNRTDNALSMGLTNGYGALDPQAWTPELGTWGIQSNQAYCPSGGSIRSASVNSGLADNVTSIVVGTVGGGNFGFSPRYVDASNFLWVLLQNLNIFISSYTSGVNTNHTAASVTWLEHDLVEARCVGSSIEVYRNSSLVLSSTRTEHQTASKQALIANGGSHWDSFSVKPP